MKSKIIMGFLSIILFSCQGINKDDLNMGNKPTPTPTNITTPSPSPIFSPLVISTSSPNSFSYECSSTTTKPIIPLQELLNSPSIIEIDGKQFQLEAELYRHLEPVYNSPPNIVRCLNASINIINKPGYTRLPASYKIQGFWIINDKEVWETNPSNNSTQEDVGVGNGPMLPEDKSYYAVVRIIDEKGKPFLIKSGKINIIHLI